MNRGPLFLSFLFALSSLFASPALATARVELSLGGMVTAPDEVMGDSHSPGLSIFGSLTPRDWPLGFLIYGAGTVGTFTGTTFDYPGFDDFLSARYRILTGDVGVGAERALHLGGARIAIGGGLSTGQAERRVSLDDWAMVTTYPSTGKWLSAAVSREVGKLDLGARGTYSWKKYHLPYDSEVKGGGLQLGLALGIRLFD